MTLVFFRSLERMKGGRNEATSAGGVGGSLRQNRCFAAHSTRATYPNIFFIFSSSVWQRLCFFCWRVWPRSEKQGSKKVFPPSPSYLFALIENCAAMGIITWGVARSSQLFFNGTGNSYQVVEKVSKKCVGSEIFEGFVSGCWKMDYLLRLWSCKKYSRSV